jgi:hypothetical protein
MKVPKRFRKTGSIRAALTISRSTLIFCSFNNVFVSGML